MPTLRKSNVPHDIGSILRSVPAITGLVAALALGEVTTQPSTQPTTRHAMTAPILRRYAPPVGNELADALKPAIDALTAEMEQAMKSPAHAVIRTQCDYFDKRKDTVSADALLDALTRRLNRDARIDAYVKWQLISIQKKPFDGSDADRALQIYVRSFPPPPRPGASAIDQRRLTAEIGQLKEADVDAYNANWDESQRLNDLQFNSFLGIRDALYARIPKDFETFRTALFDADQRVQGGYDPKPFLKNVYADIRTWASGAKKGDVMRMSDLVQSYATREPAKRFTEVAFSDRKASAAWHTASLRFDKKQCETLAADLRQIANAGF